MTGAKLAPGVTDDIQLDVGGVNSFYDQNDVKIGNVVNMSDISSAIGIVNANDNGFRTKWKCQNTYLLNE